MITIGELSNFPGAIAYSGAITACTENPVNGYCYDWIVNNGCVVYARMESLNQNSKCTSPNVAFAVFSTADGRGGVVCGVVGGLDPWAAGSAPAGGYQ